MNRGLKSYTKQIQQEIGPCQASVNINQEDANMHYTLPLAQTTGHSPFSASLIFNYMDREEDGIFGKGVKLNYFAKITKIGSDNNVKNADGSTDTYRSADSYFNAETQLTAKEVTDDYGLNKHFEIIDKQENRNVYATLTEYPEKIVAKNGDVITLDFVSTNKAITNEYGDKILFEVIGGKVATVQYLHNDTVCSTANLSYSNGRISCVSYYNKRYSTSNLVNKVSINYSDSEISITDANSGYKVTYSLQDGKVIAIQDAYGVNNLGSRVTNIAYQANKTTITNWQGKKVISYFDSNGLPIYDLDSDGNFARTDFDDTTKMLMAQSNTFWAKDNSSDVYKLTLSDPSNTNVDIVSKTLDDPDLQGIISNSVKKVSLKAGKSYGIINNYMNMTLHAGDSISAVLWCKQLTGFTEDNFIEVTLYANSQWEKVILKKKTVDNNFEPIVLSLTTRRSVENITLNIKINGNSSAEIGEIKFFKKTGGVYREVVDGDTSSVSNGYATTNFSYLNHNPSKVTGPDSSSYVLEYNEQGNPIKMVTADGVITENVYSSTYPNNLLKNTVKSADNQRIIETSTEYTSDGRFVKSVTDELGVCAESREYDFQGNLTKVTNALGAVSEMTYGNCGELRNLLLKQGAESVSADYQYDVQHRLQSITITGGSSYTFNYDGCNRISKITLNGQDVFIYEYDNQTGNVIRQQYGANGDGYAFEYTSEGLVSAVYYFQAGQGAIPTSDLVKQLCYRYSYDSQKRLVSVSDGSKNIKRYTYNSEGKVESVTSELGDTNNSTSTGVISCRKNGLGDAGSYTQKLDGKALYQAQESLTRSKLTDPQHIVAGFAGEGFVGTFADGTNLICGNEMLTDYSDARYVIDREQGVPFVYLNSASNLAYKVPSTSGTSDSGNGCVQFWFKPNNTVNKQCLFGTGKSGVAYLSIFLESNHIYVMAKGTNAGPLVLFTSEFTVKANQWNFVALNFMQRHDGLGYSFASDYALTLNEHTQIYKQGTTKLQIPFDGSEAYCIGRDYVGGSSYKFSGKLAFLFIAKHWYCTLSRIQSYYRATKDYIDSCGFIDDTEKTCDVSQAAAIMPSDTVLNQFDVFPLHCDVVSLDGTKYPKTFTMRTGVDSDRDRVFNYNNDAKCYAYVADGSELVYDFGQDSSGTVMMRAFTNVSAGTQYLLDGIGNNNLNISLYRKSNGRLYIGYNTAEVDTGFNFTLDTWHTVGLSFDRSYHANSIGGQYDVVFRVYFNGQFFQKTFESDMNVIKQMKFSVGRTYNAKSLSSSFGVLEDCYPLYGQIEMLAGSNAFCEQSTINNLVNELKRVVKTTEYDDLGMEKVSKLYVNDSTTVLKVNRTYQTRSDDARYISYRPAKEKFVTKAGSSWDRNYKYDSVGNVVEVDDAVFGKNMYAYDYRNFLVKDNNTIFTYDGNGNVTQKGSTIFSYDTVIKDRLVKVGNTPITYNLDNPIIPATYGNKSYTFMGRRLQAFTVSGSTYNYTYDEAGLRIGKTSPSGDVTKYLYNGTKLAVEIAPNYRLDFLYDEKGLLYGFVKDGTTKYFYVRDVLKNILGIIDSSGAFVVKYTYNGYGDVTVTQDTSGLATLNPFRWKGYYFDQESGMYYCHTRYYVPEWCRWLNADHPAFLKFDSLQGLNIFAYCGNNPIINIDDTGTSFKDTINKLSDEVTRFFAKIGQWFNENVGFSIILDSEQSIDSYYNPLYDTESGIGFSKRIFSDNPINFFVRMPTTPWKFWEWSVGIDVNYDGYGFGFGIGSESFLTGHLGESSYTFFVNSVLRVGLKGTTNDVKGMYYYEKIELHGLFVAAVVLAAIYCPQSLTVLIPAVAR